MNRSYGSLKEAILKELETIGLGAGRRELAALEATRTFFILNKIDYLEAEDRPKAQSFAQKALAEKAGFGNARIIPLSAKTALEGILENDAEKLHLSNLPVFTRILERFLMNEKGAAVLTAACTKGINAADELLAGLDLEVKALLLPLEKLRSKTVIFERMAAELSREQQDNRYTFQGELDRVYHELEQEITRFQESRNRLLEKKVDQLYQEKKHLSGRELLQLLNSYIESSVQEALENWLPLLEQKIEASFKHVVARFADKTNQAIGELLRQSAGIFEISVEGFTKMEALTGETRLYYLFGAEKSLLLPDPVKLSAIFLPRLMAGPKISKEMKKKVERELDRNCGRIRTDYNERIAKSAGVFQKALEEKFSSAVQATGTVLARAADKRQESKAEVDKVLAVLNEQREQIAGAKNHLATILKK